MGTERMIIKPAFPLTEEQQQQIRERHVREKQEERARRISLFEAFKDSPLKPSLARIYYPGCGSDDSVTTAFPESDIHLVDINKEFIDTLRAKHTEPNVHAVEASITEYDPGPVDALILYGASHSMPIDNGICVVKEGGFVLSNVGIDLLDRDDVELVGILRAAENAKAEATDLIRHTTQQNVATTLPQFRFEPGRREHIALVETDEEFERLAPEVFRYVQQQRQALIDLDMGPTPPESILACAKQKRSVPIPPQEPGAQLYIFRKTQKSP